MRPVQRGVAERPYEWGEEHAGLFAERFEVQRRQEGFALVEARDGTGLAGFAFGVTLQPATPWSNNLTTALPPEVTAGRPGRTFALVEMLVRAPRRRRHVAQGLHDLLLQTVPRNVPRSPSSRQPLPPSPPAPSGAGTGSPRNATRYPDRRCSTSSSSSAAARHLT